MLLNCLILKKFVSFSRLATLSTNKNLKFTVHRRKLFKKVKPDCKLRVFLEVEINNPMDENYKKTIFTFCKSKP